MECKDSRKSVLLSPAGRLFTIAQLVGGRGVVLYTAGAVAQKIVERIDAGDSLVVLAETGQMRARPIRRG